MNKIVEAFNNRAKNGEYDFYIKAMPDPNISGTLTNQVANANNGATVPDVAITCSIPLQAWSVQGYCYDITDVYNTTVSASLFEGGTAKVKDKINTELGQRICYDDKYYAIPLQGGATGILYNKKLLKELTGSEEAPQTMAEIWEIQDKVEYMSYNQNSSSADDVATFIYPSNAIGYFQYFYYCQMAQYLGYEKFYELYDLVDIENRMNNDEYKEAYENAFENLATIGQPSESRGDDPLYHVTTSNTHTICTTSFTKGRAVFTPTGDWAYSEVKGISPDFANNDLHLAAIPLVCDTTSKKVIAKATPASEVTDESAYFKISREKVADSSIPEGEENAEYIYFKKYIYSTAADVYGLVPYGSKHVEEAKKFLAYLTTDEALNLYTQYTGCYLPYQYEVTDTAVGALSQFSKECVDLTKKSELVYMASTNKAVGYSLVSMSSCSNPNFYANLIVWKTEDRPAQLAQDLYQDFKSKILYESKNIEQKIAVYERNFGKV